MTSNNNEINASLNDFITVFINYNVFYGLEYFSIHELCIVCCEQRRAIRVRCDFMMSFYFIRFLYRINLNIFILIQ